MAAARLGNGVGRAARVCCLFLAATPWIGTTAARELSFEERIAAQRAIEGVYWAHREWPAVNPGDKPPLSALLSEEELRAKVEDYLRKSAALERIWQRRLTGEQLQAELDRITRDTRDAEMLREIFDALDNDAFVIAETLARPTLADRLVRNWYAYDERFHGAVRLLAKHERERIHDAGDLQASSDEYTQTTYALHEPGGAAHPRQPGMDLVELDPPSWVDWTGRVASWLGRPRIDAVPLDEVSALREEAESLFVVALVARSEGAITIATVSWLKTSFDDWWEREAPTLPLATDPLDDAYAVLSPAGGGCVADSWRSHDYGGPVALTGHVALWTGTEMLVWGGAGLLGSQMNAGRRYTPATDSWSSIWPAGQPGRANHTAVWTGTEMIIWGGLIGSNNETNTGGRYNPATNSWMPTALGEHVPTARVQHTAVWTGTEMIIWGGDLNGSETNTGGRYDPATDGWVATSTVAPVPAARIRHTAVWTGSEMIVWGGLNGSIEYNSGGRYDASSDSWEATSVGNAPAARWGHRAVWTGVRMIVWGGRTNDYVNTGGQYSPATDTWIGTSTGANVPTARVDHTAVWTGTEMIVWGGRSSSSGLSTGGRYNANTNAWVATSTGANVPAGRLQHTAVWTGTEMIVWGGSAAVGGSIRDTGGRYMPATDGWLPTSVTPPETSPRYLHTTVWTGAEMIVWGGIGAPQATTGGRYDPATDSWTATAGAGAPTSRREHAAVWTGSEMIVWGGVGGTMLNTGGRYLPSTDSWTPTPASGIAARMRHVAVWTGTEMIVWGGWNGGQYLDTGGRYTPSANSWNAIGSVPAMPPRERHTAVWTGSEMVVWGGSGPGITYLNSGGRYGPSSGTWTPMSTGAGVPAAREQHSAVWTGTEMIVWGGYGSSSQVFATGASYRPSSDSWTTMSVGANLPSARWGHAAVWTGEEMVVWGGNDCCGATSGGRYSPVTDAWEPTSMGPDLPVGRAQHTAVWTGEEMLVWGGIPLNAELGAYCAACESIFYLDADGDGFGDQAVSSHACEQPQGYIVDGTDCDDEDFSIWSVPGEVPSLAFTADRTILTWTMPTDSGGSTAMRYDTIRSASPSDFLAPGVCIETSDGGDLVADDTELPTPGQVYYYLVRAENNCGAGPVGTSSDGVPPPALECNP